MTRVKTPFQSNLFKGTDHASSRVAWQRQAMAAQSAWTSVQWRQRLQVLMDDTQNPAAAMRQLMIEGMQSGYSINTQGAPAISICGATVGSFADAAQRDRYVATMSKNGEWLDDEIAMKTVAAQLGVSLRVHSLGDPRAKKASASYEVHSEKTGTPTFDVALVHGNHWVPAKAVETQAGNSKKLSIVKDVPGDGNCGAHALACLAEQQLGIKPSQAVQQAQTQVQSGDLSQHEFEAADSLDLSISAEVATLNEHTDLQEASLDVLLDTAKSLMQNNNGSGAFNFGAAVKNTEAARDLGVDEVALATELRERLIARASQDGGDSQLLQTTLADKLEEAAASSVSMSMR